MKMVQAQIFFEGTVQGVGFRYSTQQAATQLSLTGWVKNLPDGRVEILAEGPEEHILQLIKYLEDHFSGYIRNRNVSWTDAAGRDNDFRVTHYS